MLSVITDSVMYTVSGKKVYSILGITYETGFGLSWEPERKQAKVRNKWSYSTGQL